MNPFKDNSVVNYRGYIRELFTNKQDGDTFEVDLKDIPLVQVRATIYMTVKQKYKTKFKNSRLYVLIIAGTRQNVAP